MKKETAESGSKKTKHFPDDQEDQKEIQAEEALTEEFEKSQIASSEELPIEDDQETTTMDMDIDPTSIEVIELRQSLKQEKDKYTRLLAEMENARKRMQKEKEEMMAFSRENIILDFLAPLEQLQQALGFADQSSDEVKNWAMGFKMVLTQFNDILSNNNVKEFHAEGESFDPHLHEALEVEQTNDFEEGTILQEFSKGYKCKDRVIRPAKVKVSKKIESPKEEENESE